MALVMEEKNIKDTITNNNDIKRWTKEELEQIKQTYRQKLKELKK